MKKEKTFTVEVDASGKAKLERMLRRLKEIEWESEEISEEAQRGVNLLPNPVNRQTRRVALKKRRQVHRLRNKLEELKKERGEIVKQIREIIGG